MKYVVDTSVLIERLITEYVKNKKIKGEIIVPKAVVAELENQANTGRETGFLGLEELQELQKKKIKINFYGERPNLGQIKGAKRGGEIDSMIIDIAFAEKAVLVTADKVQAESAKAFGLEVMHIEQEIKEILTIEKYFDKKTMSVHLKGGVVPYAKRGQPGAWELVVVDKKKLTEDDIQNFAKEIVERARKRNGAFVEITRRGSTIVQYGHYRIVIVRPPVSDAWEITAVKPIVQLSLDQYKLPEVIFNRLKGRASGVLVAGEVGSGKCLEISTPIYSKELGKVDIHEILSDCRFDKYNNYYSPTKNVTLLSLNKQGKIKEDKIKKIMLRKENEIFTLKTSSGKIIKATGNHPFLTFNEADGLKWKELKEIGHSDVIATPEKLEFNEKSINFDLLSKFDQEKTFALCNLNVTVPIYMKYYPYKSERNLLKLLVDKKINSFSRKDLGSLGFSKYIIQKSLKIFLNDKVIERKNKDCYVLTKVSLQLNGESWISLFDLNSDYFKNKIDRKIISLKTIPTSNRQSIEIKPVWNSSVELMNVLAYLNAEGVTKFGISNVSNLILNNFFSAMKNLFGIEESNFKKHKNSYYIDSSGILYDFFKTFLNYDFKQRRKSFSIAFPKFFTLLPKSQKKAYLQAYFDAEASVDSKCIELTSASKQKLHQINNLLLNFGVHGRIFKKLGKATNSPNPRLRIYWRMTISGSLNLDKFNQKIGFGLKYKQDKLVLSIKDRSVCNVGALPIQGILRELKTKLGDIDYHLYYRNSYSKEQLRRIYPLIYKSFKTKYENIEFILKTVHKLNYLSDWKRHLSFFQDYMKINSIAYTTFAKNYHFDTTCLKSWLNLNKEPYLKSLNKLAKASGCCHLDPYLDLNELNNELKPLFAEFNITAVDIANQTNLSSNTIRYFLKDLSSAKPFLLENISQVLVQKLSDLKDCESMLDTLNLLKDSEIFWDNVDYIQKENKACEVFDVELEKNHNFVAGDDPFIVHNSTFCQSLAEYYAKNGRIVKTVESPRDLILSDDITQYSKNFASGEEIHDILFLSRPDNIIFDEMRDTPDFKLFVDLRLGGSSMMGVLHSASPIDAVQRFITRMEVGMIPSVLDTIIFVDKGAIAKVLTLVMKVKVPSGMTEADLARPVIEVHDLETHKLAFEIYSYGEQTVVIPVGNQAKTGVEGIAEKQIKREMQKYSPGCDVEVVSGHKIVVYVKPGEKGKLVGVKGQNISKIEQELGLSIDVHENKVERVKKRKLSYNLKERGHTLLFNIDHKGMEVDFFCGDQYLLTSTSGKKGEIKLNKKSDVGRKVVKLLDSGEKIVIRG